MNRLFESHGDWAIGVVLMLAALSDGIIEWVARLC